MEVITVVDLVAEVNIEAMEGVVGVTKETEEIKTKIEACKALVGKRIKISVITYGE